MCLIHTTNRSSAEGIRRSGFENRSHWGPDKHGVWLSDRTLKELVTKEIPVFLAVEIDQQRVQQYRMPEDSGYPSWLIPASVLEGARVREVDKNYRPECP
jgi:hypothetical protein